MGDLTLSGGTINITGEGIHGLKLIEFSGDVSGSLSNITFNGPGYSYLALNLAENFIELAMVVPEPSAFALLGWGAVGIVLKTRRRKSARLRPDNRT